MTLKNYIEVTTIMEKILKYGDKFYIGRCKKSVSGISAKCVIDEILLDNTNLLNCWRGKTLRQYIKPPGYYKEHGIFSESGLISRCLSNYSNEITVISNKKSHLKNRINTEMYKKGVYNGFVEFIEMNF